MSENTQKTKACQQFLQAAQLGYNTSQFIPKENLTPYTLYNTSDSNKDILLSAFAKVDKETLLLLVLGESTKLVENLLDETHQVFEQPFVKDFAGNISLVVIDPELRLANSKTIEDAEIDSRLKEKKVVSLQLVKAKFPLTPLYGPHKHINIPYVISMGAHEKNAMTYKQPNQFRNLMKELRPFKQRGFYLGLRRLIHDNALVVLNKLVEHPSPLFISSRITSVCYRSFKYLIDVRAAFDRKTLVRYGYTDRHSVEECVSAEDYAVFPDPFQKCVSNMKNTNFKKYYINDVIGRKNFNNTNKTQIRTIFKQMNQWANQELTKKIPKKQEAGFKRRTRRKRKSVSKP